MEKVGIFVGRICPLHIGHKATIDQMISDVGVKNSLIIIGSVGQKPTFRVLFSYHQRKSWIEKVYSNNGNWCPRIVGVQDMPSDDYSWFELVLDSVKSAFGDRETIDPVFYGGSVKDIEYFSSRGYSVSIVDRTKVPVSATAIRDLMLRGVDVSDFLPKQIASDVVTKFNNIIQDGEKWSIMG